MRENAAAADATRCAVGMAMPTKEADSPYAASLGEHGNGVCPFDW